MEKGRGDLREALDIAEAHLGTGTRPCDFEDGTRPSRAKKHVGDKVASLCLEERSTI